MAVILNLNEWFWRVDRPAKIMLFYNFASPPYTAQVSANVQNKIVHYLDLLQKKHFDTPFAIPTFSFSFRKFNIKEGRFKSTLVFLVFYGSLENPLENSNG